jgi:hypothetical protein
MEDGMAEQSWVACRNSVSLIRFTKRYIMMLYNYIFLTITKWSCHELDFSFHDNRYSKNKGKN